MTEPVEKDRAKEWLARRAPIPYLWAKHATGRLYEPDVRRLLLERYGSIVQAGPFAGMRYIDRSTCGALIPKLIGVYERELHDVVERLVRTAYDRVIVVGSAEGYYAVGLALAMPAVTVQAYDIDDRARRNLLELATLNGTQDRTIIAGECTHAELDRVASRSSLVVCDIEGAELDLLDPDAAPALRHCDVMVEIHDRLGGTAVRDALAKRFGASHDVRFIQHVPASTKTGSVLPWWFTRRATTLALDEWRIPEHPTPDGRYGLEWGVFFTRSGAIPVADGRRLR